MTTYRVRLTWSAEILLPFFTSLEADRIFAVEHRDASRVHCHALIEGVSITVEGMKQRLRKLTNSKPEKNMWSFKLGVDSDTAFIKYCLKGKYEPCFTKGDYTQDLPTLRSEWVDTKKVKPGEKVGYRIIDETAKESRKRQIDILNEVKEEFYANKHKFNPQRQLLELLKQKFYVEHQTIVGRYKMRDYYDYVMAFDTSPLTHNEWLMGMHTLCDWKLNRGN